MGRKKKATATQADAKQVAAILEGRPDYRTVTVPVRNGGDQDQSCGVPEEVGGALPDRREEVRWRFEKGGRGEF